MNAKISTRRDVVRGHLLWICTIVAALASTAAGQEDNVQVDDYGTVTLTVKDTDLAQVLEMLSIQSRKNIITSKSVSATISANLYDVTFYEALDAILRVNGYGYVEEGNFIYVYSGPELEEIKRAQRTTQSRVFELEYLAGADAFEFIAPLLSDVGQASYRGDVPSGFKPDVSDGGADNYAYTPTLVVNDYPENLDRIAEVLAELDRAPEQVLVEATIVQTTLDEANAWGVDFSIIGDMDFLDLSRPLNAVNDLISGDDGGFQPSDNRAGALTQNVGNVAGPGTLKLGIISNDVSIFMRVLDEVTDSTVLARPKVMCLNRQRAEVLVGQRVGYISTTATDTSTTQTVEFLDTGIQLIFRPFISKNGMVRMELAPSVSEAQLRDVTDTNNAVVTIPDELTNELTTNVRVPDGQTLVLGGLFRESTNITRRQVPYLGDIPVVGALFQGQDDKVDRQEIIFLITPSIIPDEKMIDAGEEFLAYAEAVQVGTRNGLLPFSRDRLTDVYNQKAIEAYNRGDVEEALYYVNNSLRIYAGQPEMVKFREQITGAKERAHERSLMDRVMSRQIGMVEPQLKSPAFPLPTVPVRMGTGRPNMVPAGPSQMPPNAGTSAAATTGLGNANTSVAAQTESTDQRYDELFKSFFENLNGTEAESKASAAAPSDVQFPFETFDDMVEVVEVPATDAPQE